MAFEKSLSSHNKANNNKNKNKKQEKKRKKRRRERRIIMKQTCMAAKTNNRNELNWTEFNEQIN